MNKKSSLHAQLRTIGDNSKSVSDHPQKTVGGVVFTQKCYVCKKRPNKTPAFTHNYAPWVTIFEGFKIIH